MALRYTYIPSDNTATNGTALGTANQDIVVKKIIIGLPVDGKYVELYDKINPVTGASTSIVVKVTEPSHAAGCDWVREIDFGEGVVLGQGGNVVTDASQVTVLWEPKI